MKRIFILSLVAVFYLFFFAACNPSKKVSTQPKAPVPPPMEEIITPTVVEKTDALLENLLKERPAYFDSIIKNKQDWKVQIIYTQINRQGNNNPLFKTYYYNYDSNSYFYPASTVKMPIAVLALQRLNELKIPGLDKNTTVITEAAYNKQTPLYNEPTAVDGRPTIAHYIKKIFLVSDNEAYNRLYEFLGQEYINSQLHKKGYTQAEILHRLSVSMTPDENRHTNPVRFIDAGGKTIYEQPMLFNQENYSERNDAIGKGYYKGDKMINEPMNFSTKNRINLEDLTNILKAVLFPEAVPAEQRFNLTNEDYKFLRQYLSQLPFETIQPSYDTTEYWPAYVKFLLYGSEKGNLPANIRIFNKVGDAYGGLSDIAYIVDFDKKIEFMLSARIYCNNDGILNDDKYEYETIGLPFMKHLGTTIYEYELNRKRTHAPNLDAFKFQYEK
jgi:hypothetical protein